jgi:hypothetical protein
MTDFRGYEMAQREADDRLGAAKQRITALESDLASARERLAAKERECERLRAALKPFARVAKYLDHDGAERVFGRADFAGNDWREITQTDLRTAHAALQEDGK